MGSGGPVLPATRQGRYHDGMGEKFLALGGLGHLLGRDHVVRFVPGLLDIPEFLGAQSTLGAALGFGERNRGGSLEAGLEFECEDEEKDQGEGEDADLEEPPPFQLYITLPLH